MLAENKGKEKEWDLVVSSKSSLLDLRLKELFRYRDLLFLLLKRDFTTQFKQTLLGPLLIFVQPVATALTFTFVFGYVANLETNGSPRVLFYLSGLTLWGYFADCLIKTSATFISNASIFGKVYFPRLIIPISVVFSSLLKLSAQFILLILIWLYYFFNEVELQPNIYIFILIPFLIVVIGGLGFGFGLLIATFTIKYRDLNFFIGFGVQLLMYASSVILPLSIFPTHIQKWIKLNPMLNIIEAFKFIFLGKGDFSVFGLIYSFCFMLTLVSISVILFNKVEKTFVDTI